MWVPASSWKCPFISESTLILFRASRQLISARPLISTKCGNYTQISRAAKAQKMPPPHYLPSATYHRPPFLTLALKLHTGSHRWREGEKGEEKEMRERDILFIFLYFFWATQRQNMDKTLLSVLIGLPLLRGAPNLKGFRCWAFSRITSVISASLCVYTGWMLHA